MTRAFVLSRRRDFQIATACAEHLAAMGWSAAVVVDPSEWPECPRGAIQARYAPLGRMVGNDCHEAIIGSMLANSDAGDVILKADCDTRITADASEWLAGAAERARAIMFGGRLWGGLWAAPRARVAEMAERAPTIPRCRCPESHLAICGLKRFGGIEIHPSLTSAMWAPPSPWPDAAVVTLPRRCPAPGRAECGTALFDFRQ